MRIIRPSPAVVAARKREIAARYRRKARKNKRPFTLAAVRIAELARLYEARYGRTLPDDDTGETAARVMTHHLGHLKDAARRIGKWLDVWTPWLGLASHERLIRDATECPLRYRADKLAWKLRVTLAERTALKLRTIGAIDQTAAERKAIAKARARERAKARRLAQGSADRSASIEHNQPWRHIGISRRTWYRRAKP